MSEQLLTYKQVSERLACSVVTVRRLVRAGALPAVAVGGLRRVREVELARYIAAGVTARSPSPASAGPAGVMVPAGLKLGDLDP